MSDLAKRIAALSPEQRKLLEMKLKKAGGDIAAHTETKEESFLTSIKRTDERDYYPTSSAQKRLFILNELEVQNTAYNIPGVYYIDGLLDEKRFNEAFSKLIERHESLRTSFDLIDGEPVQRVHSSLLFQIDCEEIAEDQLENQVNSFIRPFDLRKAPLLRIKILRLSNGKQILLSDIHHIVADGTSMGILIRELMDLYAGKELAELKVQYKDFAVWQNELFKSGEIKKKEAYWLNTFNGEIPVLDLPTDYPRPALQSFEGSNIYTEIGKELIDGLNKLATETGATVFMVLLAVYNILLAKYTGQEDIVVGSPIAGRRHDDLQDIIGMFVNTLAIRSYPSAEKTFKELLQEVRTNSLNAFENQDYQFDELLEKLELKRDLSRNPLFSVLFSMQNMQRNLPENSDLKFSPYDLENKVSKFDLTLMALESPGKMGFQFEYCTKLFAHETMERMVGHFVKILEQVIKKPEIQLANIDMLSEEEQVQILGKFNETSVEYSKDKTITILFEEQVERTPDDVAVLFADKQLTYKELNERANQLARVLRAKGAKPDMLVGLMVERSLEMIIGILGILKSGCAYLPVDPDYPIERVKYMLDDSGTNLLVTYGLELDGLDFAGEVINLGDAALYHGEASNLQCVNTSNDLAYVIYTSGSTGKPKGVMLEHKAVNNFIKGITDIIDFSAGKTILNLTTISFDIFVLETLLPLCSGLKIAVVSKEAQREAEMLSEIMLKHKVDMLQTTPSRMQLLLDGLDDLSCITNLSEIMVGGEALPENLFNTLVKLPHTRIYNMYGPTETTVWSAVKELTGCSEINIGKPIANTQVYIVDKANNLLPVGIAGELCIAGDGLARGYYNRPELTAEKFVANPFEPGKKMYRTGDLVRWLPNGEIEFIGRVDFQVKIRGYRIELGEIENELLKHSLVEKAIVVAKDDTSGFKYLCAYFVASEMVSVQELRAHLAQVLPDYMVPSFFIQLDKLPLTPNGKVDRKALPEPDGKVETGVEYVAPRNELEAKLVCIWQEVLGVEKIGINDNFFSLGGHSLKATSLAAKLHKQLNVEVPLHEIFKLPTIGELAKYIGGAKESIYAAIQTAEAREYYPLSAAQKRLYILSKLEENSTSYNMPEITLVEGNLDRERLEEIFKTIIQRHETMRTAFEIIDEEPVQRIYDNVEFAIEYFEASENNIESLKDAFIRTFNLACAPLIRIGLIKLEETKHVLLYDMHHIISDGLSLGILVEEFAKLYNGETLPEMKIQYKDFAVWQNRLFESEEIKKQEAYWLNTFSGEIPVLGMPTDYPRPALQSFEGSNFLIDVDREILAGLNKLAGETGTTMFMVLLAAYNVLLAKYAGQEDIVVGSPIAGRRHEDLQNIIGMFVNTLAIRNYLGSEKTFKEFLLEVRQNALNVFENQDYQFDELVEKLEVKRDLSRNPLFDVMFSMENIARNTAEISELRFSPYDLESNVAKFDLTLTAFEAPEKLDFQFEYCTKLFKHETIEKMAGHFINILTQVIAKPETKLAQIDMLSQEEQAQILNDFNATTVQYVKDKTINALFEDQAAKNGQNTAAVFETQKLTYAELNTKANQLARLIRETGIKPGEIVGIMAERSLEIVIGILAILKAGGAYLPVDPEYPEDRINYMLADSGAGLLLTQKHLVSNIEFNGKTIDLEDAAVYTGDGANLTQLNRANDLAYIIYTSGSTGKPKGVMIEHQGVVNLSNWFNRNYDLATNKNVLQMTNVSFDVSVEEIIVTLLNGGTVFIPRRETILDKEKFVSFIKDNAINLAQFVPTTLRELLLDEPRIETLRVVICGGEKLDDSLKDQALAKGYNLYNHYGPTETTVDALVTKCGAERVSIGKPIDNTQVYVVNKENMLVPVGVAGELCIAGDGLARGYLNRPELTAEKFVNNPFVPGQKMYKTGDLVRCLADGNIDYLGRIDDQVKVRGFRIELGEIESQLAKLPYVKEAVVIAEDNGTDSKYLCAYMVAEDGAELKVAELRSELSKELPDYMIPSYFMQLDKLPLTPNGKVDRKGLPKPDGKIDTGVEYAAPRNLVEMKLVEVWQEVLGVERVGINDNFFSLGGHSLKATVVAAKIHKELNVQVPLQQIFKQPTVADLAAYIDGAKESIYAAIQPVEAMEYYPVSAAQRRLYLIDQLEGGTNIAYNLPGITMIEGALDKGQFEATFKKLVERHETLRTAFKLVEGEVVQVIADDVDFKVSFSKANGAELKEITDGFVKPFDLVKAPLLRVELISISEDKHVLMYDMHHIISDGVSMEILVEEFAGLYNGEALPELRIQYKDYAVWQNELFKSDEIKKQEAYWLETFSGEIPVLNITTDYPRPAAQSFEGSNIYFEIDEELTKALNNIAAQTGATMYMVLLAAYNVLMAKYSGQEDIVVGSPIAGRPHADLQNIIGMFVNTLAMRNFPAAGKSFKELLKEVRANALGAYENQDYQFEELIEKLAIKRDLSRNPLFDTMLVLQNTETGTMEIPGLKFVPYDATENKVAKFDLTLNAVEAEGKLLFTLEYCTKLFMAETIERMAKHFVNILGTIAENLEVSVDAIDMLTGEEKDQILFDFNNTEADYPKDKLIQQMFEAQVEAKPDNIAVVYQDSKLTYRELNCKVNQLARVLRKNGVGIIDEGENRRNSIVAIMVERSLEMIVGIMAIVKAGGAYLPIDKNYPEDRVKYMIEDSEATVILTQQHLLEMAQHAQVVINLDDPSVYTGDDSNLEIINVPQDLAYVIYTSGSTGKPKGVMIEHYAAINRLNWMQKKYPIGESDVILQKTPFTFDVSVWELFWWSFEGACVAMLIPGGEKDPAQIIQAIHKHNVTVMHFVPSMLGTFLDHIQMLDDLGELKTLKQVFASGEALTLKQVEKFGQTLARANSTQLANLYGPTEATVDVSYYDCPVEINGLHSIPIGKPIDNIRLYVVDRKNMLVPVGVAGELCIAGDGLARGYLKRPELTAEKFAYAPFLENERIYKTGDLTRWLPDGNIEYLGRIDHQVKVRGFRIELGEIENKLVQHSEIKEAVVVAKNDVNGDKYLCAYISGVRELKVQELRDHLLQTLPDYMVPALFIQLEKLPLSANGKIDRKALPEPDGKIDTGVEYVAPRNLVEMKLVEVWQEVLGVERIGVNDNFFNLGGHSLKATVLAAKIHKELNVQVPLQEIFKQPTVSDLARYISGATESIYAAIQPVEVKEYYPVSAAQRRMYLVNQLDGGTSTAYNMPGVMAIEGILDKQRFESTFKKLVERHESLRTSIKLLDGEVVQLVANDIDFKVSYSEASESDVQKLIQGFVKPFALGEAPLLRVELVSIGEEKHVLMYDMHHIISDGVSMGILVEEFARLYNGEALSELRIQYKDFAVWQNELLQSGESKKQETYWLETFSGEIPVLNLPTDYQRPAVQSFEGDNLSFEIDSELTKALNNIAAQTGSTMYMVLLAAYNVLLAKYSGQEDIVVGSPIAGRPYADLQNIIGMFVNTLAMRNFPAAGKSFKEFLKEVRTNALGAYENQDYQFEELVEKLGIKRDLSRNPLFDVVFSMLNAEGEQLQVEGLTFAPYDFESNIAKFDLLLGASEAQDTIYFDFQYCTKLFQRETIERLAVYYINILQQVVSDPEVLLSEIDIVSEAEKELILQHFNNTYSEYPCAKTIHELFEAQAAEQPHEVAIIFNDTKLTYAQLNNKANQLARKLREKGVKQDSIVGIMVERSVEMLVGILGILKAGGAYLPVDPKYPAERIKYMLEDSAASILLTQQKLAETAEFDGIAIIIDDEALYAGDDGNLEVINKSGDLAYIIYTSGSTGKPKGVMVKHQNVVRLVINTNYVAFNKGDRILQTGAIVFDASTFEFWGSLLNGLSLYIVQEHAILEPRKLKEAIDAYGITTMWLTAPLFTQLVSQDVELFDGVKNLLVGGDVLSPRHINAVRNRYKDLNVINGYGPTENTTFSTCYRIEKDYEESIPIGKPISNSTAYIVDKHNKLQPIGVPGELCVGGDGVARGYINAPELTQIKFVPNPFEPGKTMYRTGDLARWLPDGNIEFLGRIDHQVKIRGFRIELGEIEAQIMQQPEVKESIIIVREDSTGTKYLCAYVVSEGNIEMQQIRERLTEELPDYMIPSYFIGLEKMPLNANGKVDRESLPEPDGKIETGEAYVAPRNLVESKLVEVWQEVLGVERIGINDNFFELGGHSLKATVLAAKVHKELNVELPLQEIFKQSTVAELAKYIGGASESIYAAIGPVEAKEYYPVSAAQRRVYLVNQLEGGTSIAYNMPGVTIIEGSVDKGQFEATFKKLVERHESLRTAFKLLEGEVVQLIADDVDFTISYTEASETDIKEIVEEFVNPFDLEQAPLLRVGLVKVAEAKYVMLYDMHHIIADGVSMGILVEEFARLYNGEALAELRIQYKDFAVWQNELLQSGESKKQEAYWLETFSGEIPVLNMPTDYPRPAVQSFEGDSLAFEVDAELTKALNNIAAQTGATMYMVLLAAYNVLLAKYSGQEDIVVGSPIAGRPHADLQNIIGMFVNTLAMRNFPAAEKSFKKFLHDVKENALGAYENQNYQFEELIEKLAIKRDLSRNPLFDVMFMMQNMDVDGVEIPGLKFVSYGDTEIKVAKFDLTMSAAEADGKLQFNFEYCTRLFGAKTIERLSKHFVNILKEITANPEAEIASIEMVTDEEKEQLVACFNATETAYAKDKTIQAMFEQQVEKTPESIAVVYGDSKLTYEELNAKANQVARAIRQKGARPNEIVGIMVDRSLEMLIGIMGVLKAGCAYLPVDPDYPMERVKYMLDDSGTNLLVTYGLELEGLDYTGEVINLGDAGLYQGDASNLECVNTPNDLAYVIYTSGSTGKPKGVMLEHQAVNNFIKGITDIIEFTPDKTILNLTTISFDIFVLETLLPLCHGLKIAVVSKEAQRDAGMLSEIMLKNGIDMLQTTPSRMQMLFEGLKDFTCIHNLKEIMVGGEALPENLFNTLVKLPNTRIYNMYGPTETTVWSAVKELTGCSEINIGKPIANTQIYIVDKANNLQPVGIAGELCIAGEGLARGYYNRSELTAEKFVSNPFKVGERMYRTGDLARWLPNGEIEFIGRVDFQVKIRGYRIELGEIENELLKHSKVEKAIVVAKDDTSGFKYLCAYIVASENIATNELRTHLGENLPDYMVPSFFIQLDEFPLTPNGKVDRKALPEPDGQIDTGVEYVAPSNELETRLAQIWQEVLGVERVGVNDNFFNLGGHSLKAAVLAARIHKEFEIKIPLTEIFKLATLEGMAKYLSGAEEDIYTAIQPVEVRKLYPVSAAQRRLFIINQIDGGTSTAYNLPDVMVIEGNLDRDRFAETFKELVKRHESFRTSFKLIDGEVYQKINDDIDFQVNFHDAEEVNVNELIEGFIKPFDLECAPLLRVELVRLREDKHLLVYDMHHIIADGVSQGILVQEFAELYNKQQLPALRIQYKDFAVWQNNLFASGVIDKQEAYWLNTFKGEIPVLNLPTDYARPPIQSFEGGMLDFTVDSHLTEALHKLAGKTGSTMYMVLLAAYNVLLAKYSGQEDIVVGSPIAGRPHADLQNIIGMFVNTLTMRNYPVAEKSFKEFLSEVRDNALGAYENQDYQFEELIEKLTLKRDLSRNPLFDVMLVMQNMEMGSAGIAGLQFVQYNRENKVAKFDLTLRAYESGGEINFMLEYCAKLFKPESIKRFGKHFINILKEIAAQPEKKICDIEVISSDEKQKLLIDFNGAVVPYPQDKAVYQLFEAQVAETPDNVAVVYQENKLSYRELNARANQLARVLRQRRVGSGTGVDGKNTFIVAIMAERSLEMIVSILGVLKAGAAYLPIDPEFPDDRVNYILQDSKACLLLTHKQLVGRITADIEVVDMNSRELYSGNDANLGILGQPDDLAYVIYTSGTTGMPKGVMLENIGLVNYATWFIGQAGLKPGDKTALLSSYAFDLGYTSLYPALLSGCELHIVSKELYMDSDELLGYIQKNGLTYLKTTPSLFNVMVSAYCFEKQGICDSLRLVVLGGEQINTNDIAKYHERYPQTVIMNHYGPTETTIGVIAQPIDFAHIDRYKEKPTIGRPINNTQVYILDKNLKSVPFGAAGEIYIGGPGLARGYLNRDELTAEKFVPNPFDTQKSQRLYKTGDLGRYLIDGRVEFLGRADHQVKIRGYRVELGEIENSLLQHSEISDAVVSVTEAGTAKALNAYIVSTTELTTRELREFLGRDLPDYMIPTYFMRLDKIPLTQNGKVDRNALPKIEVKTENTDAAYAPPQSEKEAILASIWSEVLGIEGIGVDDNFFQLGGDSIKAIQVMSRLRRYNLRLTLKELFEHPTISELAPFLTVIKEKAEQGIVTGEVALTPIQKWLFGNDLTDIHHRNHSIMLYNKQGFEEVLLKKVFSKIIEHHDALRMVYRQEEERIVQFNCGLGDNLYTFDVFDLTGISDYAELVLAEATKIQQSIDLTNGPLVKLALFKTAEGDHLLIVIHHLVVDGVSWRIIFEDIAEGYAQAAREEEIVLQEKTHSFKDWAERLQTYANSREFLKEFTYWQQQENEDVAALPKDSEICSDQIKDCSVLSVTLPKEDTDKLLNTAGKLYNTEINDLLLTALGLAVKEWAAQQKVLIMLEGHGREEIIEGVDISRTIGWFTTLYPVILDMTKSDDLAYQIKYIKESLRRIPHKGVGYGILKYLTAVENRKQLQFNLKPEIGFNYFGQFDQDIKEDVFGMSNIPYGPMESEARQRKYALDINGMVVGGELNLTFEYNKNQYKAETVQKLLDCYKKHLLRIIEHCTSKDEVELTPTDLGNKNLSLEEFDDILDLIGDL